MRRALLVDIDDTVVDWIGPARDAVIEAVATHRALAGADPERLADRFLEIVEETHALWMSGELTRRPPEGRAHQAPSRRVRGHGPRSIERPKSWRAPIAWPTFAHAARSMAPPSCSTEVRRRGARVVAVTNNLVAEQEHKLRYTGMRDLFDGLVISEAAGVSKPDPAIFELALRMAGVSAQEAIMLGDSWANDVMGAVGAGVAAAWLDRTGAGRPDPSVEVLAFTSLRPAHAVAAALLDPPLSSPR